MLGLPDSIHVCLFDLDGVLTDTASVHKSAWKDTFDPVLERHGTTPFTDRTTSSTSTASPASTAPATSCTPVGCRSPRAATVTARTTRRCTASPRARTTRCSSASARTASPSTRARAAISRRRRRPGLRRVVVSSSANTAEVLKVTGLDQFVEHRVDGQTIDELKLNGKPAPDSFLEGARLRRRAPGRGRGLRGRDRRRRGRAPRALRLRRRRQPARRRAPCRPRGARRVRRRRRPGGPAL